MEMSSHLPEGILSVVQTPFREGGDVDLEGLSRLVEHAIESGASGLLAPVVASEVACLSLSERDAIVSAVAEATAGRVAFIVGASSASPRECARFCRQGEEAGAVACLVATPQALDGDEEAILDFFSAVTQAAGLPLVIQDLAWNAPGLSMRLILELRKRLPSLVGLKVETVPSGPKYTQIKASLGEEFYVCGGWAVPQMVEALDRGVDGMVPESSMVRVYREIFDLHRAGDRTGAVELFRRLLPVLAFANQDLITSIAFFKRLLRRKGIFENEILRQSGFGWDRYNSRIADELVDLYLSLESSLPPLTRPANVDSEDSR